MSDQESEYSKLATELVCHGYFPVNLTLEELREKHRQVFHSSTTSDYWDCNCEEDYIHEKKNDVFCPKCKAFYADQPDSNRKEVVLLCLKEIRHNLRIVEALL